MGRKSERFPTPLVISVSRLSQFQSLVFTTGHRFALTRSFIVDSAQVQNAVYDDAMELLVVVGPKLFGIGTDRIHTDENIAAYLIALGIVESDDIGKIIVVKIPDIYIEDVGIRTEYYGNVPYPLHLAFRHQGKPLIIQPFILEFEYNVLCKI